MVDPSSGPLTFGQLSLLRSLEWAGPAAKKQETNIPQAWPIPADIDFATVEAAWFRLLEINHSLRTVFSLDRPQRTQRVLPTELAPLDSVGLVDETPATALAQAALLSLRDYAVDREPACSAVIGMYDGMPRYLVSTHHHVVTDLMGLQSLQHQFDMLLAGKPVPVPPQPLELAAAEAAETAQHEATLAYWASRWSDFTPDDRRGADDSERIQASIHTRAGLAAALAVSRRRGSSLASTLLCATYIALAHTTGRSRFTLGLVASNRFNRRWDRLVSTLNQLTPLTMAVSPDAHTETFLTQVYAASLEAYAHGSYDVDALRRRLVASGVENPDPMAFDFFFNFRGAVNHPSTPSAAASAGIDWQPALRRTGQAFNLVLGTDPEGLTVVARTSHRYFGDADLTALLAAIESVLIGLADEGARRIGDIDMTPLRELPRRPGSISVKRRLDQVSARQEDRNDQ